jgi:hypothetical protein
VNIIPKIPGDPLNQSPLTMRELRTQKIKWTGLRKKMNGAMYVTSRL